MVIFSNQNNQIEMTNQISQIVKIVIVEIKMKKNSIEKTESCTKFLI